MKKTLQFYLSTCLFLVFIFPFDSQAQYTFEREWGSKSLGLLQFKYAKQVTSDSDGHIFINDGAVIYKFSPDGELLNQWSSPKGSVDVIFMDATDHLIIGSWGHFSKLDTDFNVIFSVDNYGSEDGQLQSIRDISVDNTNNIYVLDDGYEYNTNSSVWRIQVFSPDGAFTSKILTQNGGYWNTPDDNRQEQLQKIAISDDHLMILWNASINSIWDSKVKVFNKAGEFLSEFGSIGPDPGQFYYPLELATDLIGNIYVSDYQKIHKFNSSGSFFSSVEFSTAENFIVEPTGNYIVTNYRKVHRISDTGQKLVTIGGAEGDGQFQAPTDVTFDNEGNMYVMDYGNARIQKFDKNGSFALKFGSRGDLPEQFLHPTIIQISPSEEVFVLDAIGKISKYDSLGNFILSFGKEGTNDGEFTGAADFDVDSAGYIYVLECIPNQSARVQKFDSQGHFITKWGEVGIETGQFSAPTRIVVDHENNIHIADQNPQQGSILMKFDGEGHFLNQISNIGYPNDLEVDKYGNIYGVGWDNIYRINYNGQPQFEVYRSPFYTNYTGFWINPTTGEVYITDSQENSVIKLGCTLPKPEFSVNPSPAGNPSSFIDESTNVAPEAIYTWNFGDGTNWNGSMSNVDHIYDSGGVYTASLSISQGCISRTEQLVTIVDILQTPLIPASNIIISNTLATSMDLSFTPGDGANHLVVMSVGSSPSFVPEDGKLYSGDIGNNQLVVYSGDSTYIHLISLKPDTEYFFKVFEFNQSSNNVNYLVENAPVASQRTLIQPNVAAIFPANGASNLPAVLVIIPNAVTGAKNYTIQVSESPDFRGIVTEKSGSRSQNFKMSYAKLYYVRVKTDLSPAYGRTTSFSTMTPNVVVVNPKNGATNVKTTINITVSPLIGAKQYTIELNESADFTGEGLAQTGAFNQVFSGLKYGQRYYTRVMTDIYPIYGSVNFFTTALPPVFVISPSNGVVNQKTTLSVVANEIRGATAYTIELNQAADFSSIGFVQTGPRSQIFSGLSSKTKYYARVKTEISPVYGKVTSFTTTGTSTGARIASVDERSTLQSDIAEFTVESYPNPFYSSFEILVSTFDTQSLEVNLTDLNGRVLFSESNWKTNQQYEISPNIKQGMYLLILKTGSQTRTLKVIRE